MTHRKLAVSSLSSKVDPEVKRAFAALVEEVEKYVGGTRTIVQAGGAGGGSGGAGGVSPGGSITPPPQITSLTATGGLRTIMLSWNDPAYEYLSQIEVFRSQTDDFGTAVCIGSTRANIYTDTPPNAALAQVYYYWVRVIATDNTEGPINATAGTAGSTANDPEYILELLKGQLGYADFGPGAYPVRVVSSLPALPNSLYPASSLVYLSTDNKLYRQTGSSWTAAISVVDLAGQVVSGQIANGAVSTAQLAANAVTASNILAGAVIAGKLAAGAIVAGDGVIANAAIGTAHIINAAITDAKIATVGTDKLVAAAALIGTALIADGAITNAKIGNAIQSNNYVPGSTGWIINKDGTFEANGGTFRGATVWSQVGGTGRPADNAGRVLDTRATNDPPSSYPQGVTHEFKARYVIGAPGTASYGNLDTAKPWSDNTGGVATQYFYSSDGTYKRIAGCSDPAWGAWVLDLDRTSYTGDLTATDNSSWVRPSTTLIDGNKIYTGDAYVDTLQLKGNAVTVPVGAYTEAGISSSANVWTSVQQATIASAGQPVHISLSAVVMGFTTGTMQTGYTGHPVYVRVRRGSNNGILYTSPALSVYEVWSNGVQGSKAFLTPVAFSLLDSAPAATETYYLEIFGDTGATAAAAYNRTILLLGVKR